MPEHRASAVPAPPVLDPKLIARAERKREARFSKRAAAQHALLKALDTGNPERARHALQRGASANGYPGDARIPLVHAYAKASLEMVDVLLRAGALMDPRTGIECLIGASANERHENIARLLDLGVDINAISSQRDALGNLTALARCSRFNMLSTMRFLLDRGALCDPHPGSCCSALSACFDGYGGDADARAESASMLLRAGADPNPLSWTPAGTKAATARDSPLAMAARHGMVETMRELAARGARPDGIDRGTEWPALHGAACYGHFDAALLLLDLGADPSARDTHGRLARDVAKPGTGIRELLDGAELARRERSALEAASAHGRHPRPARL